MPIFNYTHQLIPAFHKRNSHLKKCCLLLCFICIVILAPNQVAAENETPRHIALYIIIDSSGSMSTNDPNGLRWTAVRLLVNLLNDGDEVAIISFNDAPLAFTSTTNDYGPLIRIGRDADKDTILIDLLEFEKNNPPSGATNMYQAFNSVEPLVRQARSDSQPYIIFLTDGVPTDGRSSDLLKLLEGLRDDTDISIYAVDLSPSPNCRIQSLLTDMLKVVGQGDTKCVSTATELPAFFLESFSAITDRHYQRFAANGRFEIQESQKGIIREITFVYVKDDSKCDEFKQGELCISIRQPSGRRLVYEDTRQISNMRLGVDADFLTLSIQEPVAGTWYLDENPNYAYVILKTDIGMKIHSPYVNISRHAVNRPLPIQVEIFRGDSDNGREVLLGDAVFFEKQTIQLIDSSYEEVPIPLNLVYDPTSQSYKAITPPLVDRGFYQIHVEANVAGFRITEKHLVEVQDFPYFQFARDYSRVSLPYGEKVSLRLNTVLNADIATINDYSGHTNLECNDLLITPVFNEPSDGLYTLEFLPPQQSSSLCELSLVGTARYNGAPYYISYGPISFSIELVPQLSLQLQNKDLGSLLPFESTTIVGSKASLLADSSFSFLAQSSQDEIFNVVVTPQNILPGERVPIDFTLLTKLDHRLEYGDYEGTITIWTTENVKISGTNELRYAFTIIQPSVLHSITDEYVFEYPLSSLEGVSATVVFELESYLPKDHTLSIELLNSRGETIEGVYANLNSEVIPGQGQKIYHLNLEMGPEGENYIYPWSPKWFHSREFEFWVSLNAGADVKILPNNTFRVRGTRRSGIEAWWIYIKPLREQIKHWSVNITIITIILWVVLTGGWATATFLSHTLPSPNDYLNYSDGSTPQSLMRHRKLKHILFGIYFQLGNPDKERLSFRLLPPAAFWKWLLRCDKPDEKVPTNTDPVGFRLVTERTPNGSSYKLVHCKGKAFYIIQGQSDNKKEIMSGGEYYLQQGESVFVDESKSFRLGSASSVKSSKNSTGISRQRSGQRPTTIGKISSRMRSSKTMPQLPLSTIIPGGRSRRRGDIHDSTTHNNDAVMQPQPLNSENKVAPTRRRRSLRGE